MYWLGLAGEGEGKQYAHMRGADVSKAYLPLLHKLKLRLEEVELFLVPILQPSQVSGDESDGI